MSPVQYVTVTSDRSKIVAIVLCCLGFIGIGGLHRFYVGRVGTGILYLLTVGFFGIGTVIDLIRLLLGSFRDNTGTPLRKA